MHSHDAATRLEEPLRGSRLGRAGIRSTDKMNKDSVVQLKSPLQKKRGESRFTKALVGFTAACALVLDCPRRL